MTKALGLAFIAVAWAFSLGSRHCEAQDPAARQQAGRRAAPARFQPSRPTVSPYLNLFRRDTGPIPNYHLYVRPLQQQRAINEQQELINQNQGVAVQQLQQNLQQVQRAATAPTGIGAGFRNFSHYYTGLQ